MSIYKVSSEFEKSVNFFPNKKRIAFLKNNLYNDYEDSPAVEIQYDSGAKKVIHYKDNKIHNENGPAIITYDQAGNVTKEEFYIEDNYYADEMQYLTALSLYIAGKDEYKSNIMNNEANADSLFEDMK